MFFCCPFELLVTLYFKVSLLHTLHESESESDVTWPSMVTHTRNLCSVLNPSKVHTHSSEHTHTEHTPGAVGSHLCCGARGSVGGPVSCSRAPQSWYWRRRERCTFTPPTYNSCWTWDSNSQPLDYESKSLTIRPRLTHNMYLLL